MRYSIFARASVLAVLIAVVAWVPVDGQAPAAAAKSGKPLARTPDGRPDLQGTYDFATATPLQRPDSLAGKAFLTEAEAAEFERQQLGRRASADDAPLPPGQVGGYNQFWYEFGTSVVADRRTSLIVDPHDGRLPPLTPAAQERADANRERLLRPADGPEDRDASERCLLGYNAGPPMVPVGYNQNVQIVQTPEYLMIHNEMVHSARIVPLDGRPHLPEHIRPWSGESRGHWEGDTLIVETTKFTDQVWNQFSGWNWASDENLQIVERFSRVDADTLRYEFTVSDPTTWTRPWTAVVPLNRTEDQMFEYACHEGNHGMVGILRGARFAEKAAAAPGTKK